MKQKKSTKFRRSLWSPLLDTAKLLWKVPPLKRDSQSKIFTCMLHVYQFPPAAPPMPQQYLSSSRAVLWQSQLSLPGSLPQSYPQCHIRCDMRPAFCGPSVSFLIFPHGICCDKRPVTHLLLSLSENAKRVLNFIKVICIPMTLTLVRACFLSFQKGDIKAAGNPLCMIWPPLEFNLILFY